MHVLEGITVIEVSQFAAVPSAAAVLADFGADVIKIEHPVRGDAMRSCRNTIGVRAAGMGDGNESDNFRYEFCNRNKRSVAVDISRTSGQEIVHKLAAQADVFLSNLRPHELQRYRLEYAHLSPLNRRLIYGNLTGYGRRGPERDTAGFDYGAYWSRSGIAYMLNGAHGVPPFARPSIGDIPAGLALAFGITLAILARERTGVGQEVDVSLFAAGLWSAAFDIQEALATGTNADQWRKDDAPNPLTNMYRTRDARWILLTHVQPDPYWPRLCGAIERPDLERDERFTSTELRMANNKALIPMLQEAFAARDCAHWLERLKEYGLIHSLIASPVEAAADPQARAMGYIGHLNHPTRGPLPFVKPPIQLSATPCSLRAPAPELGQHTEEVLLALGYDWDKIGQLKADSAIL